MGEWRCQSILIRTMRQVSCQSHKVDSQKQHKKDNLQLWILWESQKDEIGHHAEVPSHSHVSTLCHLQRSRQRFLEWWKSRRRNHFPLSQNHRTPGIRRHTTIKQLSYLWCRISLYSMYWVFHTDHYHSNLMHLLMQKSINNETLCYFCTIWMITFVINITTWVKGLINGT